MDIKYVIALELLQESRSPLSSLVAGLNTNNKLSPATKALIKAANEAVKAAYEAVEKEAK